MNRRRFVSSLALSAAGITLYQCQPSGKSEANVPSFLQKYADEYKRDPRSASLAWFKDAKFGLFLHFGLYSLLGRGEWVQYVEKIPVQEYAKLSDQFRAENFDADFITDLALQANMKYINITSRHHDSFSLFKTQQSDFNALNTPCGRDLIAELHQSCAEKGLGLFLYYSYAGDWKHPYFYNEAEIWQAARPNYEQPQAEYLFQKDEDFARYIDFAHAQLEEILDQYPGLAGIWLDPIMGYYARPELFPIEETYALIRRKQPQALIAFKQGANGDEDFVAPEREPRAHPRGGEVAQMAWEKNLGKAVEICDTLQPKDVPGNSWGYNKAAEGKHLDEDQVMQMLEHAESKNANLLLNTGPLPDGSIHEADVKTLKKVGQLVVAKA